jgi:hypothetical protein
LIAGKRRHIPIVALAALAAIAAFLFYTGMHRSHAATPVSHPLYDQK